MKLKEDKYLGQALEQNKKKINDFQRQKIKIKKFLKSSKKKGLVSKYFGYIEHDPPSLLKSLLSN